MMSIRLFCCTLFGAAMLFCGCAGIGVSRDGCVDRPKVALIAEGCLTNGLVVTRRTVTDAIAAAGYMPLLLPNTAATNLTDAVLDHADALVLFGSLKGDGDIREQFEMRLVRYAAERKIPIVGLCHGHQMINMALGGTIARIPKDLPVKVAHRGKHSPYVQDHFHEVDIKSGSLVARALGEGRQRVNSSHSYCIDKLADGLEVTATSDDGVIEAFEHRNLPIYGFQFHPERMAANDSRFVDLIRLALIGDLE